MKDRIVEAGVEGDELVIRVGIGHLAFMAQRLCEISEHSWIGKVVNDEMLAADVVTELLEEQEDGTTPIHLILDAAILAAAEDGTEGLCEESC